MTLPDPPPELEGAWTDIAECPCTECSCWELVEHEELCQVCRVGLHSPEDEE